MRVESPEHPSTEMLPSAWTRLDEGYNYPTTPGRTRTWPSASPWCASRPTCSSGRRGLEDRENAERPPDGTLTFDGY
jgi:hypothetical protein